MEKNYDVIEFDRYVNGFIEQLNGVVIKIDYHSWISTICQMPSQRGIAF